MNTGKALFAQIMGFLPWKTFHRNVARHGRTPMCAEQFRALAFAQLAYRESLRELEAGAIYVLVAIIKKRLNLDASLYTLLQILSATLLEKGPLQRAFPGSDYRSNSITVNNQLTLFAF